MTGVATAGRPSASLHYAVGELSGKLDMILASVNPRILALEDTAKGMDQRVTTLEQFRWQAIGGGGVILFIVGSWELVRYVIHR